MSEMLRTTLLRQWSMLHHHERTDYEVEGSWCVIAEEPADNGWERITLDLVDIELGARVIKRYSDRQGRVSSSIWVATKEGLKPWQES